MADSKFLKPHADLIHCGICHGVVDKPKMLPCLHSFCLPCLSSWADSTTKKNPDKYKDKVMCPSCNEDYPLPAGGVKALKTNYFVMKLKEKKVVQQKLDSSDAQIPCTACDTPNNSVSHCVECHDFLCQKCVDAHRRVRVTKDHQLISLQEFCADNLSRPLFNVPEQEKCLKHKGEALLFFCERCKIPICRNCTVIDHPSDHKHVDLEDAACRCIKELEKLAQECQSLPESFDPVIGKDEKNLADLKAAIAKAESEIIKEIEKLKSTMLKELRELETSRVEEIERNKTTCQSLQTRLRTALEVTKLVSQIGTDHDKAALFSSLLSTMKQARDDKPKSTNDALAKVEFKPNDSLATGRLGTLKTYWYQKHDKYQWALGKSCQGKFTNPRCISPNAVGDIAITNHDQSSPYLKVIGHNDHRQRNNLDLYIAGVGGGDNLGYSQPWGLAIGKDGQYFVTDLNPYVKVFDAQGNFKQRFEAVNNVGQRSITQGSCLYGLAIDHKGRLLVGSNGLYISVHNQDGSYVSSFVVDVLPYFLAVTPNDNILVSDHYYNEYAVYIYDNTGTKLGKFAHPGGGGWYPTGMCCSSANEVYVACKSSPPAIYRYSTTGTYLGVFTKDVTEPYGLALSDDEDELLVVDQKDVKVFQL